MSIKNNLTSFATTLALLVVVMGVAAVAGQVSVPNSFTSGEVASASDVNGNFTALASEINDNDDRIEFLENMSSTGGFEKMGVAVDSAGVIVQWYRVSGVSIGPSLVPTVTSPIGGHYIVDFNATVTGFFQATLANHTPGGPVDAGCISVVPDATDDQKLHVWIWRLTTNNLMSHGFFLTVH